MLKKSFEPLTKQGMALFHRGAGPCPVMGFFLLLLAALMVTGMEAADSGARRDWPVFGGAAENQHYSRLAQINKSNAGKLKVAWTFDTGETGGLQTSPLVIGGTMYAYTPSQKVIAVDAATGKLRWKFDSQVGTQQPSRGLMYWSSGKDKRLLAGITNFVYALDLDTGKPILTFGKQGRIDLSEGLGHDAAAQSIALTTPGVVYQDLLIVGGREPETLPAPPGDIRAFDVRTGKLRWSFHTIPHEGEFGADTWPKDAWQHSGAANNWAGMALDAKRGIVYVPTGSAAFDFYGGDRPGDNLFANCSARVEREDGRADLALSGRQARRLGSRFSFASGVGHGEARRQRSGCGSADQQAGICLSVRSRERASAISTGIARLSRQHRAG